MVNNSIPSDFINDIINKIDIVDFINKKIKLKKYGKYYQAFCPFHNEKTPSFMVNRDKQFYYCFGCGVYGNIINFLMNFENLNFVDTISTISSMYGLKIPRINEVNNIYTINFKYSQKIYLLMHDISNIYHTTLNSTESIKAKSYLYSRGLNDKIINFFCIGYAINSYNNLINKFINSDITSKQLYDTGMFIKKNNYLYDRFRNRIIFPIRNRIGCCIGFGGRILGETVPKYLNSPETIIFHKGKELYGLYEVLHTNNSRIISKLLIVEGYMDVITLFQFGINYSVSSLGTATTIEHIKILFQITDHVICCYDGDEAGRKAAWRTLKIGLPVLSDGKKIQFMFLPEGEDPDSLIRKEGKIKFENRFNNLVSLSSVLFDTLKLGLNLSDYEDRAKLNCYATILINKIPSETLKLCLFQELSKLIGIPDIIGILNNYTKQIPFLLKYNNKNHIKIRLTPMRILVALLIQNPNFITLIKNINFIKNLKLPGLNLFLDIIKYFNLYQILNTTQLLDFYRDKKEFKQLIKLANWNVIENKEVAKKMFRDTLNHLEIIYFNERFNFLIKKERNIGLTMQERQEVNLLLIKRIC